MVLAEKLYKNGDRYADAWNFGPAAKETKTVEWIVKKLCKLWEGKTVFAIAEGKHPHEAHHLKLASAKAAKQLRWQPKWNLETALRKVIEWTRAYQSKADLKEVCFKQIREYMA